MPSKWQGEPKRWRLQGRASDGLVVTLGRYDTEEEANADRVKFAAEAAYRDLKVLPIAPPPAQPVTQTKGPLPPTGGRS